jgi:hypothetical protein
LTSRRFIRLNDVAQFLQQATVPSPHGVPAAALRAAYSRSHNRDVPIALFAWRLRQQYDTAWLGLRLGGEWVIGIELRERP